MNVKHLDHLNMSVRNFDETVAWYGRVFGFEVVEKGVYKGEPWGVIRAGEAMLCIYQHPERPARTEASLLKSGTHFVSHFGMRIADPEAWNATVAKERIKIEYGGAVDWPNSTAWYVIDPSGYEIEVVYWKDDSVSFAGVGPEPDQSGAWNQKFAVKD